MDVTDDILAQLEGDLCIDKSRIFATGFQLWLRLEQQRGGRGPIAANF
ncbi:MAG TPA: hypothetical protein VIW29_16570 [Polyangiaceae bacterium]